MKLPDPNAGFAESDVHRLAAAAHYVIARTDPSKLGATKLNKILWYADLEHYRRTGESLTGAMTYVRLPHGPVPHKIEEALDLLKREGAVIERRTKVYDYDRRAFVWVTEPDTAPFTGAQIDTLNVWIETIKDMTANEISDITHQDALWLELENGRPIPLGAGAVIPRAPTERELRWAIAAE
jgi:hypothetical protein